jgi:hypothetical protein
LPAGIINAADSQLEKASESCERWEWGGAGLVVVAVIAEFIIAGVHPLYDSFWEQWGSAIADAVIAFGIIGEVLFSARDGKIQTELRKRSNEKLSEAITRAAALETDAAELRKRAADLEQITAWRKISPQEKERMIEILKPDASGLRVFFEYQNGDMETYMHAVELAKIFVAAGAEISGHQPNVWLDTRYGLSLSVSPDITSSAVSDAFKIPERSPTFSAQWQPLKMWPVPHSQPRPNVHVAVYTRPPPLSMFEASADDAQSA